MASDDWSLTPATLARVAELPTPDVPDPDALGSDALAALERGARLGVDSCGICGAPETTTGDDDDAGDDAPPSVECARCRAIVYCGEAHMAADARAHARVCDLLAFDADLADVDVPDADARAAAAVKATVAKLKLLGRRTTATLLGPRGYGDEGDDENEAAARAARDEATKPRWRALFKLARSDDAKDAKDAETNAETAATLKRHADLLSAPLSLVAASWLFPVVKYALMLGVGGEGRAEEDETAAADKELTPAVVHVVHGSGGDWCDAAADAMWLVGYGAALEKPGVEVAVVAPDLPDAWHGSTRSVGGDEKGTRSVSFHRGRYDDFAAGTAKEGGTKGDDASPASTGPCLVFALDLCEALDECEAEEEEEGEGGGGGGGGGGWMRSVRAAGCPVLTANRNRFELAAERERMEDELGYVLVGMARNPFPCPVPRQSPASANEVHRRNEWLAAYVPAPLANPANHSDDDELRLARGAGKRSAAGDESEGDRGDGGGEKRARR